MHIGEGSGRGSGRVGSDFLSVIAGRVGSGQRSGGSGRVGSKKSDPWTTLTQIKKCINFILQLIEILFVMTLREF